MRSYAFVLLGLLACSGEPTATIDHSQIITAAEALTPRVGEVWTFVNGYGDTTTIVTEAPPDPVACRSGRNTIWHYHKTATRAYWNPGIEGAEIIFVLHQNPDSSWRSTASVISFPHSCVFCNGATTQTWDIMDNQPSEPLPYQIAPPTLRRGDHLVYETFADARGNGGLFTLDCLIKGEPIATQLGHGEEWRTEFYIEDVSTPIYSGPAAVSEQRENCNATRTNYGCGHEKWWFAPGLGLVKVRQFNTGSGVEGDLDSLVTMMRVKT